MVGASKNVGGLTGFMMANKWSNCYSYNTVKAVGAPNAIGKDVAGKAESKTAEEFADGTVLALLGDAYVQRIGVDPYPVFAEALPTAAITVELERDNYAKHAEVIARVYLTGTQTAGTDRLQPDLQRGRAGAADGPGRSEPDGGRSLRSGQHSPDPDPGGRREAGSGRGWPHPA
ncbi:MAG: hypothetical protein V8S89_05835 [Oscillospiraceae bacterium]